MLVLPSSSIKGEIRPPKRLIAETKPTAVDRKYVGNSSAVKLNAAPNDIPLAVFAVRFRTLLASSAHSAVKNVVITVASSQLHPIIKKHPTNVRVRPNLSMKKDIKTTPTMSNSESKKLSMSSRSGCPVPKNKHVELKHEANIIRQQPKVE